jgi:hypothetical protein
MKTTKILSIALAIILLQICATSTAVAQEKQKRDSTSIMQESYDLMLKYLPTIKNVINEHVAPASKEVIKNDKVMRATFGGVYQFLPAPIRWVVEKETFVDFCLKNRDMLLEIDESKPETIHKVDSTKQKESGNKISK